MKCKSNCLQLLEPRGTCIGIPDSFSLFDFHYSGQWTHARGARAGRTSRGTTSATPLIVFPRIIQLFIRRLWPRCCSLTVHASRNELSVAVAPIPSRQHAQFDRRKRWEHNVGGAPKSLSSRLHGSRSVKGSFARCNREPVGKLSAHST